MKIFFPDERVRRETKKYGQRISVPKWREAKLNKHTKITHSFSRAFFEPIFSRSRSRLCWFYRDSLTLFSSISRLRSHYMIDISMAILPNEFRSFLKTNYSLKLWATKTGLMWRASTIWRHFLDDLHITHHFDAAEVVDYVHGAKHNLIKFPC